MDGADGGIGVVTVPATTAAAAAVQVLASTPPPAATTPATAVAAATTPAAAAGAAAGGKHPLELFPDDVWYHLACYLPSLRHFALLWTSCPPLLRAIRRDDGRFWGGLVLAYCAAHGTDFSDIRHRLGLGGAGMGGGGVVGVGASLGMGMGIGGMGMSMGMSMGMGMGMDMGVDKVLDAGLGLELLQRLFGSKKCSRSGCYARFCEWDNHNALLCKYHPGKLRGTGLLSCCRGKGFRSAGCKTSRHDGLFFSLVHMRRDDRETGKDRESGNSIDSKNQTRKQTQAQSQPSSVTLPPILSPRSSNSTSVSSNSYSNSNSNSSSISTDVSCRLPKVV